MEFLQTQSFWEVCAVLATTSAACSVLGTFLVLRRMALMTDAIGHVLLLGIIVAYLITGDPQSPLLVIGAAATGLATVALVEAVSRSRFVKEDAAIGLVFPALFAAGIILTTLYARQEHLDVDRVLFGQPELSPLRQAFVGDYYFGPVSLVVMAGIGLLNAIAVALFFKELKLTTFDARLAATLGFLPAVVGYGLMGLVSLTVVTAFDAVGPVLVVAFFVVPPATAYLLTDRLSIMLFLGIGLGVVGALGGTVLAYWLSTTIAGMASLVMGSLFALAFLASPRHGVIAGAVRRARHRRDFFDTMLAIHLLHHEGTTAEADESRHNTLHLHLNWPVAKAESVANRLCDRGWAEARGEHLALTPAGRSAARAAVGQSPREADSVS